MGAALFVEIRFCDRDPFARGEPVRQLSSNDTSIIAVFSLTFSAMIFLSLLFNQIFGLTSHVNARGCNSGS